MPYIGVSPQFGVRKKHTYTATAGQTSFSGAGSEGATLSYTDSNFVDVYQNGVKLGDADYTSTSGTAIVLAQGASVDDLVEIIVFDAFSAADTVSKADGGTFDGNVTMAGTLDVTGAITSSAGATITTADNNAQLTLVSTDADSGIGPHQVFYRNSASPADDDLLCELDFRGRNDNSQDVNYATVNVKANDVTDGEEDGEYLLQVMTAGSVDTTMHIKPTEIVFNEDQIDRDFRIESDTNANAFFLEASTGRIGMGTNAMGDYHANRDDLVIATSGSTGITLVAGGSGHQSAIAFADGTGDSEEAAGLLMYNHNGNKMHFYVADTEIVKLSSVNMAIFSGEQTARLNIESNLSSYTTLQLKNNNSNNSGIFIIFIDDGGGGCGSISQASNTTVSFNTSSDYRLKENVNYDFDATARLKQLKPARFNFIADETNTAQDGFLAHEVSDIVPIAVVGDKDGTEEIGEIRDADGNIVDSDITELQFTERKKDEEYTSDHTWTKTSTKEVYQQIDHSKLVPLLTKSLQEALTRIDTLEAEVKALKGE